LFWDDVIFIESAAASASNTLTALTQVAVWSVIIPLVGKKMPLLIGSNINNLCVIAVSRYTVCAAAAADDDDDYYDDDAPRVVSMMTAADYTKLRPGVYLIAADIWRRNETTK
jgi:hypothetical protein